LTNNSPSAIRCLSESKFLPFILIPQVILTKKITMNQSQEHKDPSQAKSDSRLTSRLGHWLRVTLMVLSFGFIFPNGLAEDEDIAK